MNNIISLHGLNNVGGGGGEVGWRWVANERHNVSALAYGNGTYVAVVGYKGYYSVSTDEGKTWTRYQINIGSSTSWEFGKVYFYNGKFYAIATLNYSGYYGSIYSSVDGITWAEVYNGNGNFSAIENMFYIGGKFIATGYQSSTKYILISSTGLSGSWTRIANPIGTIYGAYYWNGNFYICGGIVNSKNYIYSTDMVTINTGYNNSSSVFKGFYEKNGYLYAVREDWYVYRSSDGLSWVSQFKIGGSDNTSLFNYNYDTVELKYYLQGVIGGVTRYYSSTDGLSWAIEDSIPNLTKCFSDSIDAGFNGFSIYVKE